MSEDASLDSKYTGRTEEVEGRIVAKIRKNLGPREKYRTAVHESVHLLVARLSEEDSERLRNAVLACQGVHMEFFPALAEVGYKRGRQDLWEEVIAYYLENLGTSEAVTAVPINELKIWLEIDSQLKDLLSELGFFNLAAAVNADSRFSYDKNVGVRKGEVKLDVEVVDLSEKLTDKQLVEDLLAIAKEIIVKGVRDRVPDKLNQEVLGDMFVPLIDAYAKRLKWIKDVEGITGVGVRRLRLPGITPAHISAAPPISPAVSKGVDPFTGDSGLGDLPPAKPMPIMDKLADEQMADVSA